MDRALEIETGSTTAGRDRPTAGRRPPQPMTVPDLTEWVGRQVRWIAERSGALPEEPLFVYEQAAKLVEEVGELHAELLGRHRLQRAGRGRQYSAESLASEVADVAICLAILARITGVDLEEALRAKMATIDSRVRSGAR